MPEKFNCLVTVSKLTLFLGSKTFDHLKYNVYGFTTLIIELTKEQSKSLLNLIKRTSHH